MKTDEVGLQNILKAYGKGLKPNKNKIKVPENKVVENSPKKIDFEELDIINYDKDGKAYISPKKKDALVDFFE